ncbi:serine/threonine protein kinase [Paenibacillus sp. y28]|uniref:serine/threonine protein kinase n=1 Tax=Paenibacillus sp. y28 TaxID=3129110 RepID=UPI0030186FE2
MRQPAQPFICREGSTLGERYRIVSRLGEGGMSTVFLAEDVKLPGKKWAVKAARPLPDQQSAWLAEAEVLVRLNHPYLPQIVDYFAPDEHGTSYLVMDYIQGETLDRRFVRRGREPWESGAVLKYAIQLSDLFAYLHGLSPQPIIYRDLKPSNVMIDEQDNVRLIDFGIARSFKAEQSTDTVQLGTIGFAAPEQFAGRQTDARTDLYGLGALMYYLLSGGLYYPVVQKPLQNPAVPSALSMVVDKLLESRPEDRYQDAEEVKAQLVRLHTAAGRTGIGRLVSEESGNAKQGKSERTRLIVIGGLYPGAGSTFVTTALARSLNRAGLAHTVLEYPGLAYPVLHEWTGKAQRKGQKISLAYSDSIAASVTCTPVIDGCTRWLTREAAGEEPASAPSVSVEVFLESLADLAAPLVLLDVSSHWTEDIVALSRYADHVIYVADVFPAKLQRIQVQRVLRSLAGLLPVDGGSEPDGKQRSVRGAPKLHFAANRHVLSLFQADWTDYMPSKPAAFIPALDYADLLEAEVKSRCFADMPQIAPRLDEALQALLGAICETADQGMHRSTGSWWFPFKRRRAK